MSIPQKQITLYFDINSPFSYFCFATLLTHPLFTQKNVKVTFTPVSLGIIMKKSGNTPPVIPGRKSAKQDYISRDYARRARVLRVPILKGLPKGFPGGFDTRPILRILLVLEKEFGEGVYVKAIEKFYHALWRDGVDFTSADISKTLLTSLDLPGNPDVQGIIEKAESEEVKDLLNKYTQEVLDQGSFGLPWIKVTERAGISSLIDVVGLLIATNAKGETDIWWGVDQLTQVAGFLELDWPEGAIERDPKIKHML